MKQTIFLIILLMFSCDNETEDTFQKDLSIATEEFENGNYLTSLEKYNSLLKKDETSQLYMGRGFCNMKLNYKEESLSDFTMALSLDPANKDALAGKSLINIYNGNYESAITSLELLHNAEANYSSSFYIELTDTKINYIKALSYYLTQDFENCFDTIEKLETISFLKTDPLIAQKLLLHLNLVSASKL